MAKQTKGCICLLYVIPRVEAARLIADIEQVAMDSLRGVARKWLHGKVPYQIIVRTGAPVSGLLKAEKELAINLAVMATHGRTGKKHAVLGSITERVVRQSTCPVLTIRPK